VNYCPAFRLARAYRVYVDRDALYLIRVRGLAAYADGAERMTLHPGQALINALVRPRLRRWHETAVGGLDARGPRELLDAHRANLRIDLADVESSHLRGPRWFDTDGQLARWSLTARGAGTWEFRVEDEASLQAALEHLPARLGPVHRASVAWDELRRRPLRVKETRQ
jgi:hypothetical protein